MKSAVAVFGLILVALPLAAQRASENIQVTLVEVPVNVVDRNGAPVRNLTAQNFELFDSGQSRAITHFEAIDLAAATRKDAVPPSAAAERNFLLLFDLSTSQPGTLARAREAAQVFVKSAVSSGDRIAVATFSAETGVRLLTAFTNDRRLISAAIDTLGAPKYFQPVDPLLMTAMEMHRMADEAEHGAAPNDAVLAEVLRMQARTLDRAANDVQRQFIRRTLENYADLAHVLDRVPGRKQVILLSEGFDAKLIHGRESLAGEQVRDEQRMIEAGEVWRVDNDNRYGDSHTADELKMMPDMCRRADVVMHAIDIRGVRVTGADLRDNASPKSNEALYLLTHDTGGMVFKNANSLDEDFQRLLRAEEVIYVLGFQAPSRNPGTFHDLKVKLVNVPSAKAFARAGYFELSPALSPMERTLTASEIVSNEIPQRDVIVHTMATPFPRPEGRAQVPVIVEIDGRSILQAAKANQIQSEVFIYAFDDQNQIRDFVHQPLGLDVNKLRQRLEQHGVRLYETLMLPPGHYSIRTLVRAGEQSLFGFNSVAVDVPAYDQVAVLGGTAVDDKPGDWVPVKPPDRKGVPGEYPFAIAGAMLVPAAAPVLHPGVPARVALFISHLTAAPSNIAASVGGKTAAVKIASQSTTNGNAKLLLDVVPPALPPGDYELQLKIPDLAEKTAVVPFAVR